MIGVYLLFFTTFLFLGEWISHLKICKDLPKDSSANCVNPTNQIYKDSNAICANHTNRIHKDSRANRVNRAKYIFAVFATIFCALPIVFVLWDYYSLAKLFYSLFGGISVFSALLMVRFALNCALHDFGKSAQRFAKSTKFARFAQKFTFSPSPTNPRAFLIILAFSFPLFLGHLDLVAVDIFSGGRGIVALFVGAFIIALYFADKIVGILALVAFIVAIFSDNLMSDSTQGAIFALFDGYLLIYSFVFSVVWGIRKILGKD